MRWTRTRRYMLLRNAAKQLMPFRYAEHGPLEDGPELEHAESVLLDWPPDVRKPHVGLVPDTDEFPYWTKYRRFLQSNDISFEIYDIHRSSWLAEASRFDMVVWRPMSYPHELEECRRKFHLLESRLGVTCYPSFAEAVLYEDKIAQFDLLRHYGLPVIDTFVSHSEEEAMGHLASCAYPVVWKLTAGSGSFGVELALDRRSAERWVRRVFSFSGRSTYWPYVGQKNYVYLQRLVPNAGYDVRVAVVGSMVFGYHRDVPRGEFRASGMNLLRWDPPSLESMRVARRVAEALDLPHVAVDMLSDRSGKDLKVIEFSSFFQMESPCQLRPGGVPGAFVFDEPEGEPRFVPMRVWLQELALRRVMEDRWLRRRPEAGGRA